MVQLVRHRPSPSSSPSSSPSPLITKSLLPPKTRTGNRLNRHLRNALILVSLVYLLVIKCESSSPEEGERERNALLEFKNSLENADKVLNDWNNPPRFPCPQSGSGSGSSPSPRTAWTGVVCYNGNVWGLQLDDMKLSGEINVDSLLQLGQLRSLSFKNNNFEGTLPEFRKLAGLKALFISKNYLFGGIDNDAFVGMSSLQKVCMADNQFTGRVPTSLASSPRLIELNIENNQFIGPIPNFPPTLVIFNASNNQLQGPIPPSLRDISASSFSGNKNLCGPPLGSVCDEEYGYSANPSQTKNDKEMSALTIIIMIISTLLAIAAIATLFMLYLLSKSHTGMRDYNDGSSSYSTCTSPGGVGMMVTDQRHFDSKISSAEGKLIFVRDDEARFDLHDLLRASAQVLGSGSFGSAYKAVLMDGHAVVVKRFRQMTNCKEEEFHEHMRRLGRLSHPNLLHLIAYHYRKQEKLLVFNFVHNGSLQRQLHGKDTVGLDWPNRLKIIKGVANGMAYLYTELVNLVVPHGNLKSSNVLLDKSMQPVLIDYTLVPVVNVEQGKNWMVAYKAPEYINHGRISKKLDVWSFGILILETMTGKLPANFLAQGQASELGRWVESIQGEAVEEVFDKEMKDTENAKGQMVKLLKIGLECCEVDVEKRPELEEVVNKIQRLDDRDN